MIIEDKEAPFYAGPFLKMWLYSLKYLCDLG